VLSLGAKSRGLKPGSNILILFPKDMCILFYPKLLAREKNVQKGCMLWECMHFPG
jgi:hypothetical protein